MNPRPMHTFSLTDLGVLFSIFTALCGATAMFALMIFRLFLFKASRMVQDSVLEIVEQTYMRKDVCEARFRQLGIDQ